MPARRKLAPKTSRLTQQIKRAKQLARMSVGPVAELYVLHAEICERKRKIAKKGPSNTAV
ncbi:MAG: hypothetical protein ACOZAM_06985 [Pseudomonadota bacterium]